jgi:hypothetical protein
MSITCAPSPCGPAFPSSLAGRDSCDYYGHCVAIGLAPRRRSHVRPRHTYLARLRRPTHLLECPHWTSLNAPEMPRPTFHARAERDTGFGRLSGGCELASLEMGLQAIKLSPYRAGPPARRPIRLDPATGFLTCCCPLNLSAPGKSSDPGTSFRFPPRCAGDMTRRLVAHNVCSMSKRRRNACQQRSTSASEASVFDHHSHTGFGSPPLGR